MRIRNLKLENKKKLWICHFFQDLKKICWGGADRPIKENWTKQGIYFNPAEKLLSYGLKTEKNETKTLLMCLQAYLLKPLLFAENEKENKRYNFVFLLKWEKKPFYVNCNFDGKKHAFTSFFLSSETETENEKENKRYIQAINKLFM